MKLFRRIILVVVVLLCGAIGYFAWTVQTKDLPEGTLVSASNIKVLPTSYGYLVDPIPETALTGMVFLAGAFIGADAYVPFARSLAAAGHPVRVIGLESGVAQLPGQQARLNGTISSLMSGERAWVIGGHSLGSAYAAMFAAANESQIKGLFMVGTGNPYTDLSALSVPVTILGATNDNVANGRNDDDRAKNLPPRLTMSQIEGGNHAQFGYYGPQIMDGTASLSRQAQQAQMTDAALNLLDRIDNRSAVAERNDFTTMPRQRAVRYATQFAVPARLQGLMPQAFRQES
ncbi:alpha/beta hydrolase [Devosia sp.]|uniref:alpha/beta hydrolase n=1 Tax=Devosia sp. TaxID=1871048 RepID=UPI00326346D2